MTTTNSTWVLLMVLFVFCGGTGMPLALAQGRPAREILADIDNLEKREPSKDTDEHDEYDGRLSALIGELYRASPNHERLGALLPKRWEFESFLARQRVGVDGPEEKDPFFRELNDVQSRAKDQRLRDEAAYYKARTKLGIAQSRQKNPEAALPLIEEFARRKPKDLRVARLLYDVAFELRTTDVKQSNQLKERILADFPTSNLASLIQGERRKLQAVGTPFDLSFKDVISGAPISTKDLRGKVIVVDFWATWCGPCVNEMPKMKELYAEHKAKGVEFIGVSLDPKEGGLESLKAFVQKEGIAWPQYFENGDNNGEFSLSWGITTIPAAFVVDQDGKLYSIDARGKLDQLIPELLRKGSR